ncbi:site-specific integrase [Faecalispora jeddahensis]|uniref:site-specific integrase n=1 Tax=Faecalispora jeddahensis TaxID=1414721 RepID=UPI0027BAEA5F|nr:site-specific integrase [Faecalispora jeddahensis]
MPAYKDKERKTWYASFYYTDWKGQRRLKKKRGFAREKDAKAFEAEFLRTMAQSCDMTFGSMTELYLADMENRLKENTIRTKRYLIEGKILPFFKDLPLNKITAAHVRKWQSELLAREKSQTYVKTINNQLSAIFNYACRYYGLSDNPARVAGSVGKKNADTMKFWTADEFNAFIPHVPKMPARVGLSVLFWTGLRIGELLALGAGDVNLEAKTLSVTKSFQMIDGKEVVTEPKTVKSKRVLPLPAKLCEELRAYMAALYEPQPGDRLFPYTKSYFHQQMTKGCEAVGMEKIRLHDLRHSHAALLIHLGVPILLVSERLGHEDVETTLRTYGHLYPTTSSDAVQKLDDLMP